MDKPTRNRKARLFMLLVFILILLVLISVLVGVAVAIISNSVRGQALWRSEVSEITSGRVFEAENSPYPAEVVVLPEKIPDYPHAYFGYLTITLPKGSSDPRITRSLEGGYLALCQFTVDYWDGNQRRTLTWLTCVNVSMITVVPKEIFVKIDR